MAAASLVGAYFLREAFVHLIWWVKAKRHLPKGLALSPFPSWELQVLLAQVQGLAESSGDAIGSRCLPYEVAGGFVLLFLLLFLASGMAIVIWGLWYKEAVWNHISLRECFENMKEAVTNKAGEQKTVFGRAMALYDAIGILHVRGDWDEHDVFLANRIHRHIRHGHIAHHASATLETRFVERFGPLFDSWHRMAWWYGIWSLSKSVMLGIILVNVLDPIRNAAACLTLACTDSVILVIFNPDGDWHEVAKNTFRSIMNVSVVASVLAFVQGTVDEEWFAQTFQLLSPLSMAPMLISSLLTPLISAVSHIWVVVKHAKHFCGSGPLPGGAVAAGIVGVGAGIVALQNPDDVLGAADEIVAGADGDDPEGMESGAQDARDAEAGAQLERSGAGGGVEAGSGSQEGAAAGSQGRSGLPGAAGTPSLPGFSNASAVEISHEAPGIIVTDGASLPAASALRSYLQHEQQACVFPPMGAINSFGPGPLPPVSASSQLVYGPPGNGFFP